MPRQLWSTFLLSWMLIAFSVCTAQEPAPPAAPKAPESPNTASGVSVTSAKGFVLEDGTPVRMRINRTISSADSKTGDTVDFEVLDNLELNGVLVISKGGLAFATITEAQAKRRNGPRRQAERQHRFCSLADWR